MTAFMEGRHHGPVGVMISLLIGLPVGFGVFCTTRTALKRTITHCRLYEPTLVRTAFAWCLILAAVVWTLVAALAVLYLTKFVLRHIPTN